MLNMTGAAVVLIIAYRLFCAALPTKPCRRCSGCAASPPGGSGDVGHAVGTAASARAPAAGSGCPPAPPTASAERSAATQPCPPGPPPAPTPTRSAATASGSR